VTTTSHPRLSQLLASATKPELDRVTPEELLAPSPVTSADDARLVKAALYLKHGFLDDCHKIAQQVETATGSYWHGIMHRHEGDISNSHYWYHRVGNHPVLTAIGGYPQDKATEQREFNSLLDYTVRQATGSTA
jgi:hypothetical protein